MTHGRSLLAAFILVAAAAGCDHRPEDFTRVRSQVSAFHDTWTRRVAEVEVRHTRLQDRARALPADSPGLPELQQQLADLDARLDAFGARASALRTDISSSIQQRRRKLAEAAVVRGNTELQAELDALLVALDGVAQPIEVLEGQAAAKQSSAAAIRTAQAGPNPLDPDFARTPGATAELGDIEFLPGQTALDLARAQNGLDTLVKVAQACPELTLKLTVHLSPTGDTVAPDELAAGQAGALGRYLQSRGVPPTRFQIAGGGVSQPRLPEVPAPGAPPLEPSQRAALQELNRRVTVTVVTPCT